MSSGSGLPSDGDAVAPAPGTAVDLVLTVSPSDDAGATTADRYDWQAAMAAADGLALYARALDAEGHFPADCDARVLCEWQEDWVLLDGNEAELVSAKHRDPSVGAFTTVAKLADEGGLIHLFNRWSALGEQPSCRLVTTGGLGAGDPQALDATTSHLRQPSESDSDPALDTRHHEVIDKLHKAITGQCAETRKRWTGGTEGVAVPDADQRAEVARFLSRLRLDHGKPQRAHIDYAAPAMFAQPVLDRLELKGPVTVVWEAVLRLFRARMRAKGPIPNAALPVVMSHRPESSTYTREDFERQLISRIVTMRDIDLAIKSALAMPAGYEPLVRVPLTTRLAVKMNTGGCSDNAVERAEHLRIDYQEYWRGRVSGEASARVEQARFERQLLRINDEATDAADSAGAVLWRRLQEKVDALPGDSLPPGMDAELALGGLCELANRCKVWFGQRFDVEAVITRLRTQRGAGS